MTRDEFIDRYTRLSNLNPDCRTTDGFSVGRIRRKAVPCDCGDKSCDGWAMIEKDAILL